MRQFTFIINSGFIALWQFLEPVPEILQLILLSALTAVFFMFIFGKISNQKKIAAVKNKIKAYMLESLLFKHDLGLSFSAQMKWFSQSLVYFMCILLPFLVLLVPCVILFSQIHVRFGLLPFEKGNEFLVKAFAFEKGNIEDISIYVTPGLELLSPPLRIPEFNEIDWKLRVIGQKNQTIYLSDKTSKYEKTVCLSHSTGISSNGRYCSKWMAFLNPGEDLLPEGGAISAIEVLHREKLYDMLNFESSWWVIFLVVSFLTAFLLKRWFRVDL